MKTLMVGLIGVSLAALMGCSSQVVRVGPKPPASYRELGPARGSACGVLLFDLIPINVNHRTRLAYEHAVAASGGTMLIDTEIRDRWYYIYVGQLLCTNVQGIAIK